LVYYSKKIWQPCTKVITKAPISLKTKSSTFLALTWKSISKMSKKPDNVDFLDPIRVARFFLVQAYQIGKNIKMTTNYTKQP
jgi:hypothetical protein